jgi:hypothetical protein
LVFTFFVVFEVFDVPTCFELVWFVDEVVFAIAFAAWAPFAEVVGRRFDAVSRIADAFFVIART